MVLSGTHLYHFFVNTSFHVNGCLSTFSDSIHGSLNGGVVTLPVGINGNRGLGLDANSESKHQNDVEKLRIHVATIY